MKYEVTIPWWNPPRLNQCRGRHWSAEHRLKKDAAKWLRVFSLGVPRATGRRRVSLVVTLGPRQKQPDADAHDKLLLDALVRCGLLLDDSARGLEGRLGVEFRRGERPETTLTLEDV